MRMCRREGDQRKPYGHKMARRYCKAAKLGLCSEEINGKEISCLNCFTPYAIGDLRDTRGLSDLDAVTARLLITETLPLMNWIRPLSKIIVSYLQIIYRVGDGVDALDGNRRVYPSIIVGVLEAMNVPKPSKRSRQLFESRPQQGPSSQEAPAMPLYRVRFLGWPNNHDILIDQSGIRPLTVRWEVGHVLEDAYKGSPWSSDARWDEGQSVCLSRINLLINQSDTNLNFRCYAQSLEATNVPIPIPLARRIQQFIRMETIY